MAQQLIISVSREYGSGGHDVALALSRYFELPFYDKNLLDVIAEERGIDGERLKEFDESPINRLLYRTVRGHNNSPEAGIAHLQFDYLREKAESGESFVVVGRCSEDVLKNYPGFVSIFVLGDRETKIQRVMDRENMSYEEAAERAEKCDKNRKTYHNTFTDTKWGDSRNYDLSVNSSKLGIEKTIQLLETYIDARVQHQWLADKREAEKAAFQVMEAEKDSEEDNG